MDELRIETRNRSRSKTPFLRSNCDNEHCTQGEEGNFHPHHHHHGDKKKKPAPAPKVQTIVEETVEVTSSSSPTKKSSNNSTPALQKIKTIEQSKVNAGSVIASKLKKSEKNSGNETKTEAHSAQTLSSSSSSSYTSSTTTTSSTVITKSQKQIENQNIAANLHKTSTSTPKTTTYAQESFTLQFNNSGSFGNLSNNHKSPVSTKNDVNSEFQQSTQEHRFDNNNSRKSLSKNITNNSVNNNSSKENISGNLAYVEYKAAGEYWKKYPKTDYTYSELSPHRREVVPGVIAMPNMSRESLEKHNERITYMIKRNPDQEEYIRRRYEQSKFLKEHGNNRNNVNSLVYDSQDEIDEAQFETYGKKYGSRINASESWLKRIISSIFSTFSMLWSDKKLDDSILYRTKVDYQEQGIFGSIWSRFVNIFQYVYLFISSVLCFDTWLLSSSNAENRNKKRFLLLLLILLPLLLLAGLYYYLHPNEPFPPTSFSKVQLSLPAIDMTELYNPEQYEELKTEALNRIYDIRAWTDDYFMYLKTVSNNIVDEGRKLFQKDKIFERV